jgi:hypothetical protein
MPSVNLLNCIPDEHIQLTLGKLEIPTGIAEFNEVEIGPVVLQSDLASVKLVLTLLHQSNLAPNLG